MSKVEGEEEGGRLFFSYEVLGLNIFICEYYFYYSEWVWFFIRFLSFIKLVFSNYKI